MRFFARMGILSVAFASLSALFAQDQGHRLSVGFGGLNPLSGSQSETFNSAPLLTFDYGYRFFRYGVADVGVDTGFASDKVGGVRRNLYIPRFGYSLLVPLMHDRV